MINSNNTYSLNNDYSSKKYTSLTDLVNSETEKGDVWGRFSSYGYDGKVNFKLKLRIYKLYCKWLGGSRTDYLIVPAFITLPTNTERRNMKGVPSSFPGILYQKPSNGSDIFKDQKSFTSLNTVKLTDIDQKDKVTGEVTGWLKASSGVQYIEYNNQRYQYGISSFNFNNGTTQLNSGSLMQKLMDDPSLLFSFNTNAFNNSKNSCGLSYDIADQSLFENRNYSYNSYKRSSYTFTSKNTYYQNGTLLQSNTVKVLNSKCDIYINYSKFNINRSYSSPMIKETLKSSSGSIIKENTTGSKNSSQYSSIKYSTVKYMANTTITYNNYVKKATNDVKNLKFISIQGSLINNSAIENKIKSLANINKFYHTSERTGSWHDYWIDNSRNFNLNFYSIPTNELNDILCLYSC